MNTIAATARLLRFPQKMVAAIRLDYCAQLAQRCRLAKSALTSFLGGNADWVACFGHFRVCVGFRMPASDSGATYTSGRRPKAAKERTRGASIYAAIPRCRCPGGSVVIEMRRAQLETANSVMSVTAALTAGL